MLPIEYLCLLRVSSLILRNRTYIHQTSRDNKGKGRTWWWWWSMQELLEKVGRDHLEDWSVWAYSRYISEFRKEQWECVASIQKSGQRKDMDGTYGYWEEDFTTLIIRKWHREVDGKDPGWDQGKQSRIWTKREVALILDLKDITVTLLRAWPMSESR